MAALKDDGRNQTESLYRSEPNTLCFKAYCSPILLRFKLFFRPLVRCPLIAQLLPFQRSLGVTSGDTVSREKSYRFSYPITG
jgi:hypothetical protein